MEFPVLTHARPNKFPKTTATIGLFTLECQKLLVLQYNATRLAKESRAISSIQSRVKPEPLVTRSHTYSRAWRQLHVFTSSFDWFIRLSTSF